MSFFGQYLVQKGLVQKEGLVRALVEQTSWAVSPQQIVFEYKLMSAEQILEVFQEQFKSKKSFIESAKKLGYWKEVFDEEIEARQMLERVPLGQVLVKLGLLTQEQATSALDDFLSQQNK